MKLTVIGGGNMGGACAIGLAKGGALGPQDITVCDINIKALERFKPYGIGTSTDNRAAVKGADIVIFVVKPWLMKEVVENVRDVLDYSSQLLVCMAPGVRSADMLAYLDKGDGKTPSLCYVIPNIAIEFSQSMSFIAPITADSSSTDALKELFSTAGSALVVEERLLAAGTALASCGIAYALRYIRASSEAGVELGFYAHDSIDIVSQTVKGAAALLDARGDHPEAEIDKVTTPGGITIKGLNAMEAAGFTASVIAGVKAGK